MNSNLQHRAAHCRARITDAQGTPLNNKKLALKQLSHKFLFGCNCFDALPFCNNFAPEKTEELRDRMDKWLRVFNYATLPFYWGNFEKTEGQPGTDVLMKSAKFLVEKGVTVKGHPLCWHTACADWLMAYDNKTILKKQLERIDREVIGFKGVIDIWDVINEVVIMPIFDKYDNAITRICGEMGRVELVKAVFDRAHAANPSATLLLNDFNTSHYYEQLIEACLDAGVPIGTIGIQSHQHQGYWGAEKLEDVLSRFSRFGLPIHFTENTIISGDIMPPEIEDLNDFKVDEWPSTPEGEARQAKETEEMYRILFAHPLVEGITNWDFADGAWLGAPSGIIRKDNSVKPAYEMLDKLINDEWRTECEIQTDENGFAEIRGFKGGYSLNAGGLVGSVELDSDRNDVQIVMK